MTLRDEIARIIYYHGDTKYLSQSARVADEILSLPSGMLKIKKCPECSHIRGPKVSCELCCNGEIITDLTVQEAIDALQVYVQMFPIPGDRIVIKR